MNQRRLNCRRRILDAACFHLRSLQRRLYSHGPIYFCLSSGRCGSAAIVRLLQANGMRNCYHERRPDLQEQAIAYYQRCIDAESVAAMVRKTRSGVLFESNNRMFSLARPIQLAFPQARFVHLFRDGRDVVRSGMQRGWYQETDRFRPLRLGSDTVGSPFEKVCRYWAEVNQRIAGDLRSLGCCHLPLRFEDLVRGTGIEQLEDFLNTRLAQCRTLPLANQTTEWTTPDYYHWCADWQRQFHEICGPVMKLLGYSASHLTFHSRAADGPRQPTHSSARHVV